jgi:hypothetical protein
MGPDEKVSWCVPLAFEGKMYSIAHRKMGFGLFVPNPTAEEEHAQRIASLIHMGVEAAEPYFEWLAEQAMLTPKLNVTNSGA